MPTHEEWRAVETGFRNIWNFSRCCGAIDGKFTVMKSQSDTGKQSHKIALMAVCDNDYCFKYVDVWSMEKMSADVFGDSNLIKALETQSTPS